jgi:hypothetical protein
MTGRSQFRFGLSLDKTIALTVGIAAPGSQKKPWPLGIIIPAGCLPIESFFAGDSGGDEVALSN